MISAIIWSYTSFPKMTTNKYFQSYSMHFWGLKVLTISYYAAYEAQFVCG